ncbi:hypothetical protein A6U87_20685 [Rhizobium sp. AC44/96]|uniref:hypothetical protein n=1 Tax=unclassified Rhizobium TaxID=2613769 RepID=UPI00080FD495|nr:MULTISPECIES: hypothetical protein [unclassified Rhizobium]MDM9621959.1 hypothetical protein [Rhizobium sp. S96]OCJ17229.1 hypothetical protein A6U87_20685 [Rhizobium sp. AC44/96]
MKALEYRAAVAVTGLNAADIKTLFGAEPVTHLAWAEGTEVIPRAVALGLLLMLVTNTNVRQAEILVSDIRRL